MTINEFVVTEEMVERFTEIANEAVCGTDVVYFDHDMRGDVVAAVYDALVAGAKRAHDEAVTFEMSHW